MIKIEHTRANVRHPRLKCKCVEGFIVKSGGAVEYLPGAHDCQYIKDRNALIPLAELTADTKVTNRKAPLWAANWNKVFSDEMTKLAKRKL